MIVNGKTELEGFDKAKIPFPVNFISSDSLDFEEVTVPVPWGHISGKWWGSRDVQPVLALHGWQDNCGTFDKLAPLLRDRGLSIFCIDLPGHGYSSHLPPGMNYSLFWDGIHFVRRLVKHFDWKDLIMMGHSLGGAIAFLYAAVYPKDIKKYISIDISSPYVRSLKKMLEVMGPSVDKFLNYEKFKEPPTYETTQEMLDLIHEAHKGSLTRESAAIMLKRAHKPAPDKPGSFIFTRDPRLKVVSLGLITSEQALEFAKHITCEVLNVRGNQGMVTDPPEMYEKILDEIECNAKRLERLHYEGTHHLHLNNAEPLVPCIYNFIVS